MPTKSSTEWFAQHEGSKKHLMQRVHTKRGLGVLYCAPSAFPSGLRQTMLVFSVTQFKIDQNKNQNRSVDSPESGKWKKVNIQRLLPKFWSQQFFLCEICGEIFHPNLTCHWGQRVSQPQWHVKFGWKIYRDLYGDAMLVPIRMGTNMAAGSQQKHLSLSFATKAWIYPSRNSKTLK